MIRGETREITIRGFPVMIDTITDLVVIFKQMGEIILQKDFSDCEKNLENNTVSFLLSQQESLMFGVGQLSRSVIFVANGKRYETTPSYINIKETAYPDILGN